MPIACLISQDTQSIKDFLKKGETVTKIDKFLNNYHLFIVVLNNPKKSDIKKDMPDKWHIYDVLSYDISQSVLDSSDVLIFINGQDMTVFEKVKTLE